MQGEASEGKAVKPKISLASKKIGNVRKKLQEERNSDRSQEPKPKGNRPQLKGRPQTVPASHPEWPDSALSQGRHMCLYYDSPTWTSP